MIRAFEVRSSKCPKALVVLEKRFTRGAMRHAKVGRGSYFTPRLATEVGKNSHKMARELYIKMPES